MSDETLPPKKKQCIQGKLFFAPAFKQSSLTETKNRDAADVAVVAADSPEPTAIATVTIPELPFHPPITFTFPKHSRTRQATDKTGNVKEVVDVRSCQSKWFAKWNFLHYDAQSDSIFCHTCAHATHNKNLVDIPNDEPFPFINVGFKNFHDPKKGIEKHLMSKLHRNAGEKLSNIKRTPIEERMNLIRNENQSNARKYLELLFSSVKFLTEQGFPLRGHDEKDGALFNLMKERISHDHPDLINLFEKRDNWLSSIIQNEIVQSFAHAIQRSLNLDIEKSQWVGAVADGTTDLSGKEQFSVCIQYVNFDTLEPENAFVGLYNSPDSTGKTLAYLVKDVFVRNNIDIEKKLNGFAFDGASNMSGAHKGAKAIIKEHCPKSLHIHCSNHALDLGLQEVARNNSGIANALQFCKDSSNLIRDSSKRRDLYMEIEENANDNVLMLCAICPTRWCVRAKAMDRVLTNYSRVLATLKEISEDSGARGEARAKANGLYKQGLQVNTYFYLLAGQSIFTECEIVAKQLQCQSITAMDCIHLIDILKNTLQRFRADAYIAILLAKTATAETKYNLTGKEQRRSTVTPGRLRYDGKRQQDEHMTQDQKYKVELYSVLDLLIQEINSRFAQEDLQVAASREKLLLQNNLSDNDDTKFVKLLGESKLPVSFDISKLKRHILQLKDISRIQKLEVKSVRDVASILTGMEPLTRSLYSEAERLVVLILCQPISVAQAERSFSCLRRLKTWLRSTMSQARLTHLAMITMHRKRLESVDIGTLIANFIEKSPERRFIFGSSVMRT